MVRLQIKLEQTNILIWEEAMSVNFMHALASPNLSHAASKAVVLNCDGSCVPV